MRLLEHASNVSPLRQMVFDALPDVPIASRQPAVRSAAPIPMRLANGDVQRAICKVLAVGDGPMRPAEVRPKVERLLGQPVSKNSVACCLAAGSKSAAAIFERVGYGQYQLAD